MSGLGLLIGSTRTITVVRGVLVWAGFVFGVKFLIEIHGFVVYKDFFRFVTGHDGRKSSALTIQCV